MTLGIQINKMDHLYTAAELPNLLKKRERVFSKTLLLHIATKFLLVPPTLSILDMF